MTPYMTDNFYFMLSWNYISQFYYTSHKTISVRYHVMRVVISENPGTELPLFSKKNPAAFGNVSERSFRIFLIK